MPAPHFSDMSDIIRNTLSSYLSNTHDIMAEQYLSPHVFEDHIRGTGGDFLSVRFGVQHGRNFTDTPFSETDLFWNNWPVHPAVQFMLVSDKNLEYPKDDSRVWINGTLMVRHESNEQTYPAMEVRLSSTRLEQCDASSTEETILTRVQTWRSALFPEMYLIVRRDRDFRVEILSKDVPGDVLSSFFRFTLENIVSIWGEERLSLVKEFNRIIEESHMPMPQNFDRTCLSNVFWKRPVNLKRGRMYKDFLIAPKYDGIRGFLFTDEHNTFLIHYPNTVKKIGPAIFNHSSLLDVEFCRKTMSIYVFDILMDNGVYIHTKPFRDRLLHIDSIFKTNPKMSPGSPSNSYGQMSVSELGIYKTPYFSGMEAYRRACIDEDKLDGLIFKCPLGNYCDGETYKWKPADKMTIDFKIRNYPDGPKPFLCSKNRDVEFKPLGNRPILDKSFEQHHEKIVEAKWDFEKNQFIPVRVRYERLFPNGLGIGKSIWEDIKNPINVSDIL